MDRERAIERDTVERRVGQPTHGLGAAAVNVGFVGGAVLKLRIPHHRRLHRSRRIERGRLVDAQLGAAFNTRFELRNDLGRQLLAHHHRHGLAQGFTRMGYDESLELGPASRRELDALGHERGARRRNRREVTLSPQLKLTERRVG